MHYAFRRTSSNEEAQDIASEVFVRMYRQQNLAFTHSLRAYAFRVAHNLIVDWYRHRSRFPKANFDDFAEHDHELCDKYKMEEEVEKKLLIDQLVDHVHLTEEQRVVIRMVYVDGCKPWEVAIRLDKTEGAVKALMHRAKVCLVQIIQTQK